MPAFSYRIDKLIAMRRTGLPRKSSPYSIL